jgi:hypothetical protein
MTWTRVTREAPCPICSKPDWCTVSETTACCMRIESDRQMRNGGWAHRLGDQVRTLPPIKPRITPTINAGEIWARWLDGGERFAALARTLGLTTTGMGTYGWAWAPEHRAWAIPMIDGHGWPVGIRLRAEDGRKWAVRGSRQGLFCPMTIGPSSDTALICEGPTDALAAFQMGYWTIGRPSCLGCHDMVVQTIRKWKLRRVVIVADRDGPGRAGAQKLAADLRCWHKVVVPPAKDLRAWRADGAAAEDVRAIIDAKVWIQGV